MGLDTYPSRSPDDVVLTPADVAALAELEARLCMWDPDDGSFRGDVYLEVVDRVAGVCLTQDWIAAGEVAEMAAAFAARDPEEIVRAAKGDRYPVTAEEVCSLRQVLRVCADRGLGLIADH
jgi:hypothetical protein